MTILSILLAAALFAGDEPEVKAEMIPVSGIITPGGTSLLAVHLELEPGWHVYWENPGDSGLATTMQVKGPKGFVIGSVQYPAPERIDQPGGLVCFGYEDTACLFVEVTAPETLKGVEFDFTAEVQWLVCDDVCFSGEAKLSTKLRWIEHIKLPAPDKRLEPHLARLPKPLSGWPGATAQFSGSASKPVLTIILPPYKGTLPESLEVAAVGAELFPKALPGLEIEGFGALSRDSKLAIRISGTFSPQKSHPAPSICGVLVVTTRADRQITLSFDPNWPSTAQDP